MDRPKRTRKERKFLQYDSVAGSSLKRWTVEEKHSLLRGLQVCSADDIETLHKIVPSKQPEEIATFIRQMRQRNNGLFKTRAPIEVWLAQAEELVIGSDHSGTDDQSQALAQVMSIASNLEPHTRKVHRDDPDYKALYAYMAGILRGEEPPELNPIESAVMLDLLQGLANTLKTCDFTEQRELMLKKYKLLSTKVDKYNRCEAYTAWKRALENDLETEDNTSEHQPGTSSACTDGEPRAKRKAVVNESTDIVKTTAVGPQVCNETQSGNIAVESEQMSKPTSTPSDPIIPQTEPVNATKSLSNAVGTSASDNMSQPNDILDKPLDGNGTETETESRVIPVSNGSNSQETVQIHDVEINENAESVSVDDVLQNELVTVIPNQLVNNPSSSRRGRAPKNGNSDNVQGIHILPEKTPLYSLNPYCIPVKYLRPKPKSQ